MKLPILLDFFNLLMLYICVRYYHLLYCINILFKTNLSCYVTEILAYTEKIGDLFVLMSKIYKET